MGAYLAAGIGGHFGSPLALLRGVLGGRVGVEVELHHSCRIVLEKSSKRFLDRNRCNRRNIVSVFYESLALIRPQSVFLSPFLVCLSFLDALRRLENDETNELVSYELIL